MTIRPILGVFAIAGTTVLLVGCDDWDDFGRLVEGKPTKAQVAHEQSVSLHLSSAPPVVEQEVEVPAGDPADCVVPAALFRSMQCDEAGNLIPIR